MAVKRDKVLRDAEKLVQKGKLEQAIKEYEKVLKKFPDDTTTINRVGDLYGRIGQLKPAIKLYEEIAEHFTKDGFTTKAIAILKKIQRLDPQRLDVFERLAALYFEQGLVVEAKREYQILADWYVKNGDVENAIISHEKLVDLDPNNHVSSLRLAELLLRNDDTTSALKVYSRLGGVLLEAGKLDEAESLYRRVIEKDPQEGEFLIPVCAALLDAGRAPVVLEFLNFGVERSPDSTKLKTLLVRTLLGMGESTKAMQIANEVLEAEPDNAEMRSLVGGAMVSTGDTAEAREMLVPAVETMLEKGDFKGAQEALKDLLKEMPEDQQVLRLAVRAYGPSGEEETLFALRAALAESLYTSGDEGAAKRLFFQLLETDPENAQFRQRLAVLDGVDVGGAPGGATVAEDVDEIVLDLDQEMETEEADFAAPSPVPVEEASVPPPQAKDAPTDKAFDLEERLAEASVFAKYGLVEKAINHLEDVLLSCPEELEPRRRLALLYIERGDRDQAIGVAQPIVEHHRAQETMEEISDLLEAIPELGEAAEEPEGPPTPFVQGATSAVIQGLTPVAAPPADHPPAEEFMDEDSDLIEVVDVEGDLATPPPAEEPELVVEEFAVDFSADAVAAGAPVVADEEVSVVAEEEASVVAEEEAAVVAEEEAAVIVEEEAPVTAEETVESMAEALPEMPPTPAPAPPPVVEEVAEELVEISDTFVGPSMGDLDQIDFFIDQELYDDAARVLARLEEEHGEDPEVLSRRLKLKEVGVLLETVEVADEGAEELFADEEQYIDLAKELEAELAAEEAMVEEATGRGKGEAILEEVFREFQKGVAEQLSEEDSDTHFNLGIAYREMGLLPEAIREFQVAAKDAEFFVESCSVIGVCYQEQGMWSEATEWYQKALVAPNITDDARIALRYDLAGAYEGSGDGAQALGIYEEIMAADPSYRDVSKKLLNLSQESQAN
jgi:pilus assembly protein FimV